MTHAELEQIANRLEEIGDHVSIAERMQRWMEITGKCTGEDIKVLHAILVKRKENRARKHVPSADEWDDLQFNSWMQEFSVNGKVAPEPEDLDPDAKPTTEAEQAHEYRLAQARCLIRLFRQWKAEQN